MAEPSHADVINVTLYGCESATDEIIDKNSSSEIIMGKDTNVPPVGTPDKSSKAHGLISMAICGVSSRERIDQEADVKQQQMPSAIQCLQNLTQYLDTSNTVRYDTSAEPTFCRVTK